MEVTRWFTSLWDMQIWGGAGGEEREEGEKAAVRE